MVIPLLHRLSNKNELTEMVYSKIKNIDFIFASAVTEVENRYHRSVNSIVSSSYARNRKEILELSDLVADISANYLSTGSIYQRIYSIYKNQNSLWRKYCNWREA